MKKLTAIFLLALFTFNTIGFRLMIAYASNVADNNLEAKLDNGNYNQSELITIKIPLNLPYQSNWQGFERVNGEIDVDGIVYKYVRRRVYNDTLILQCIASSQRTNLQKKANDYYGKVNDLPARNNNSKKVDALKQLSGYYDDKIFFANFYRITAKIFFNIPNDVNIVQQYIAVDGQPPRVA